MTIVLRKADLELQNPVLVRQLTALKLPQPITQQPTRLPEAGIHPVAIAIPVAATAWFVLVAWLAFGGGEMNVILGAIAVFALLYLGLFIGGGANAYDALPERAPRRSFREFFRGEVEIATGRIAGREAFWQIVTMPLAFAIGFAVIAIIAITV
jgi:hypothetical protein